MTAMDTSTRTEQGTWLRCFSPRPDARATVVCFPHAGGAASYFHTLSTLVDEEVELFAVQYPGRQERRREACLESVDELSRGVLPELLALPDRPTAYFGHSLGASVGFEAARLVQSAGGRLDRFLPSGRPGPLAHRSRDVHLKDDAGVLEELRRLSGTDARLLDDPEIIELVMPSIRADYRAAELYTYVPGEPLTCPITALHGSSDDWISDFDAGEWEHETTGGFDLEVFEGGHFYLADEWPAIAAQIDRTLPTD